MNDMTIRVILALLLNAAAAVGAVKKQSVTTAGGVTGFAVGAGIFISGGLWLWSLLVVFFGAGSASSQVGRQYKEPWQRLHEKGSRRDSLQVLANGGIGLIAAVGYGTTGRPAFALMCAASFAVANADTCAGEIGVLNPAPPRSILSGRRIPPGTSGGVSILGTAAAAAGAAVIAATFALGWAVRYGWNRVLPPAAAVTAAGFAGALIDSLLGATVQAHYADAQSGEITERRRGAGGKNRLVRGWRGFNNDAVNFASNLAVSAVVLALA